MSSFENSCGFSVALPFNRDEENRMKNRMRNRMSAILPKAYVSDGISVLKWRLELSIEKASRSIFHSVFHSISHPIFHPIF